MYNIVSSKKKLVSEFKYQKFGIFFIIFLIKIRPKFFNKLYICILDENFYKIYKKLRELKKYRSQKIECLLNILSVCY